MKKVICSKPFLVPQKMLLSFSVYTDGMQKKKGRKKTLSFLKNCPTYENEYKRNILHIIFFVEQKI